MGWFYENSDIGSGYTTHPVAGKDANACGLYDMSGNVWEWTQDWYAGSDYTADGRTDPEGASEFTVRVVRGGGWYYVASLARVANRDYVTPSIRYDAIGFRLTRTSTN